MDGLSESSTNDVAAPILTTMPPPRLSFKLYEVVFEGNALNEDCALLTTKYSSALAAGVKLPCNPLAEIFLKVNPVGCGDGTTLGRLQEVVVYFLEACINLYQQNLKLYVVF